MTVPVTFNFKKKTLVLVEPKPLCLVNLKNLKTELNQTYIATTSEV